MTALYSLISPFMDEVTKSKVRILGSDFLPSLLEEIAEDHIPVDYGGSMETRWAWPFSEASGCSPAQVEQFRCIPSVAVVAETADAAVDGSNKVET